ncbi:hypothetical protein Scep_022053 [Stephania cephalantha]|uniref:Uncharacterized protein n=1 Tax=Stephania cephalantha TaxID=152367 RepID=A0AAP0I2C3_9MAGN
MPSQLPHQPRPTREIERTLPPHVPPSPLEPYVPSDLSLLPETPLSSIFVDDLASLQLYAVCLATLSNMTIAPAVSEASRQTVPDLFLTTPSSGASAHSTPMSQHSAQHASHSPCHSTQHTPLSLSSSAHHFTPPPSIAAHIGRSLLSSSHGLPCSTYVVGRQGEIIVPMVFLVRWMLQGCQKAILVPKGSIT